MSESNKLEQVLELLLAEENEKAEELLHEYVVEKARSEYEKVLDEADDVEVEDIEETAEETDEPVEESEEVEEDVEEVEEDVEEVDEVSMISFGLFHSSSHNNAFVESKASGTIQDACT